MSNSIWKTRDEKPKGFSFILEHHKAYDCDYHKNVEAYNIFETGGNPQNPFDEDTIRWCYLDDLIAQADKAERLQKAVDFLSGHLRDVLQLDEYGHIKLDEITKQQIKTAISDPVGIIMKLEQESNN